MTSSIVSEQRCGKTPADIMAGLCRSIVENAFTKVIRISNLESLGKKVVVQGGTFLNDAVLRALEQHIGREVTRAPYPGLMGAIGIALLTQEHLESAHRERGEVAASLETANAISEGREPSMRSTPSRIRRSLTSSAPSARTTATARALPSRTATRG